MSGLYELYLSDDFKIKMTGSKLRKCENLSFEETKKLRQTFKLIKLFQFKIVSVTYPWKYLVPRSNIRKWPFDFMVWGVGGGRWGDWKMFSGLDIIFSLATWPCLFICK